MTLNTQRWISQIETIGHALDGDTWKRAMSARIAKKLDVWCWLRARKYHPVKPGRMWVSQKGELPRVVGIGYRGLPPVVQAALRESLGDCAERYEEQAIARFG